PVVTLSTGLDNVSQTTMAYVRASWTRPNWRYIDRYLVRIRRIGTDTYQYQETTEMAVTFHNLIPNVQYGVQVAVADGRGALRDWSMQRTITLLTDTNACAAPTGVGALTGTGKAVSLSWNANTEDDLAEDAVYRHTSNNPANATKVGEVTGTRFV